jgi:hypothetical protein
MIRKLAFVCLVIWLLFTAVHAQVVLTPTDALSFDYDNAIYQEYSVTGFQVQYDGAGTWQAVTVQTFTDAGTLAGHTSYKFTPPYTTGNHTVSLRACNVFGCGTSSTPFGFGYAVNSAPTAQPVNVRKVQK